MNDDKKISNEIIAITECLRDKKVILSDQGTPCDDREMMIYRNTCACFR